MKLCSLISIVSLFYYRFFRIYVHYIYKVFQSPVAFTVLAKINFTEIAILMHFAEICFRDLVT